MDDKTLYVNDNKRKAINRFFNDYIDSYYWLKIDKTKKTMQKLLTWVVWNLSSYDRLWLVITYILLLGDFNQVLSLRGLSYHIYICLYQLITSTCLLFKKNTIFVKYISDNFRKFQVSGKIIQNVVETKLLFLNVY